MKSGEPIRPWKYVQPIQKSLLFWMVKESALYLKRRPRYSKFCEALFLFSEIWRKWPMPTTPKVVGLAQNRLTGMIWDQIDGDSPNLVKFGHGHANRGLILLKFNPGGFPCMCPGLLTPWCFWGSLGGFPGSSGHHAGVVAHKGRFLGGKHRFWTQFFSSILTL